MADPIASTPRQRPRYGWVRCESCSGTGKSRHFKGNSAAINHLARGGNPTELPCSVCFGDGRIWAIRPADS